MIASWRTLRVALALTLALLMASSFGVRSAAARPIDEDRAEVTVTVMQATPVSQDVLSYTIRVVNRGHGWARYAKVSVPYDATALKLKDVQFTGVPAWLTANNAGLFQIRTERLNSGGSTTIATVRFARLPGATGAVLTERLAYSWGDATAGGSGRSNLPFIPVAGQQYAMLKHEESGMLHLFSANTFVPGEPVVFWFHTPDGMVEEAEVHQLNEIVMASSTGEEDPGASYATADANGAINIRFRTSRMPAGPYTMVAHGYYSGLEAVGECMLP
jgi:hypothetical protein